MIHINILILIFIHILIFIFIFILIHIHIHIHTLKRILQHTNTTHSLFPFALSLPSFPSLFPFTLQTYLQDGRVSGPSRQRNILLLLRNDTCRVLQHLALRLLFLFLSLCHAISLWLVALFLFLFSLVLICLFSTFVDFHGVDVGEACAAEAARGAQAAAALAFLGLDGALLGLGGRGKNSSGDLVEKGKRMSVNRHQSSVSGIISYYIMFHQVCQHDTETK